MSTPEEVLRHNIEHMVKYYSQPVFTMKNTVIRRVRDWLSKGQPIKIGGQKASGYNLARFKDALKGKKRQSAHFWKSWSTSAGGLDSDGNGRGESGRKTFIDTYVPEAIFDKNRSEIRWRKSSDPEPKPCALLLNIMAEMFPEDEQSASVEILSKSEGIVIKTKVETEEIQGCDHGVKLQGSVKEVKTENILDRKKVQRSNNSGGQKKPCEPQKLLKKAKGYHGSKAGDGGYHSQSRERSTDNRFNPYSGSRGDNSGRWISAAVERSTDNRFNPYSGGQYGYEGSRAGYGGYSADRSTGNSSGGQYGSYRPRAGYGGYNSDHFRGSTSRGDNSGCWISATVTKW